MKFSRFRNLPLSALAIWSVTCLTPSQADAQSAAPAAAVESSAIAPGKLINLLEPSLFNNYVFHLNEAKSMEEEREKVWKLVDGKLHVTGKGFGYIRTRQAYKNYHLVMDYKWGEKTWPPREDKTRDCGLLVHGHGEDGSLGNTWLSSVEAQLIEGGSGDILVLQGQTADGELIKTRATAETRKDRDGEFVWKAGGEPIVFPQDGKTNQRINWRDRDPDWEDVKGFLGEKDVENPLGEWNRLEVICDGDKIEIRLNGEVVNAVYDADPAEGWICLQAESAECWVGRLEIWPIGGFKGGSKPVVD